MPIVVVAGLIWREGELLISQRLKGADHGLYWEFPGGKLEMGETPEEALERELYEELDIVTRTGDIYCVIRHEYPDKDVLLLFYKSELVSGEPRAVEAERALWVRPAALTDFRFPEADEKLIARILEQESDN